MDSWQGEVRGLVAWRGCVGWDHRGSTRTVEWTWGDGEDAFVRYAEMGGPSDNHGGWPLSEFTPNLQNLDTLAAFDRRLALRLGAPEEAVAQGVTFGWWPERQSYVIAAGVPRYPLRWMVDVAHADDPVLARVRAWQSVQDGR